MKVYMNKIHKKLKNKFKIIILWNNPVVKKFINDN
jgi:hypothetical protein